MLKNLTEQVANLSHRFECQERALDKLSGRVQVLEETRPTEPESPKPRSHHHDSDSEPTIPTPPQDPRRPLQHNQGHNPGRPQHHDPEYYPREPHHYDQEYIHRRPNPDFVNPDEQIIKNIRFDAPTFDGSLDPKVYNDWERDMDQYFDWYEISEGRKYKFVKTKLIRQARLYWQNVELLVGRRGDDPITTWRAMKLRLREKYMPESYRQRCFDQW